MTAPGRYVIDDPNPTKSWWDWLTADTFANNASTLNNLAASILEAQKRGDLATAAILKERYDSLLPPLSQTQKDLTEDFYYNDSTPGPVDWFKEWLAKMQGYIRLALLVAVVLAVVYVWRRR